MATAGLGFLFCFLIIFHPARMDVGKILARYLLWPTIQLDIWSDLCQMLGT